MGRANNDIQEKVICSIPTNSQRPRPCQPVGRSTRRDTKHNIWWAQISESNHRAPQLSSLSMDRGSLKHILHTKKKNNKRQDVVLCIPGFDLLAVWHGLGRWGIGGNGRITFSLYIIVCSVSFVIFCFWELVSPTVALSWACRSAWRGQHLVLEQACSSFNGVLDNSAKRRVTWFAVCVQSARTAGHTFQVH